MRIQTRICTDGEFVVPFHRYKILLILPHILAFIESQILLLIFT